MDLGLKGKVAMVAAASKGLGFAVARQLAAEGARVSICSHDEKSIYSAKEKIQTESHGEVVASVTDLRNAEAIGRWCEYTHSSFGGVDALFVNTGGPPAGVFKSFDDGAWQVAVDLLLFSAVRLVRAVIPSMKERSGGSILFSASSAVKEPLENLTLSNVVDRKSTRLNSSHIQKSRMPSSA